MFAGTDNDKSPINDAVFRDNHRKYFLPRVSINKYNVLIDGRNFYDELINDLIKQYDKVRKISSGQGNDYTTESLLDYTYFADQYRLIAVDLSKQI